MAALILTIINQGVAMQTEGCIHGTSDSSGHDYGTSSGAGYGSGSGNGSG